MGCVKRHTKCKNRPGVVKHNDDGEDWWISNVNAHMSISKTILNHNSLENSDRRKKIYR